MRDIRGDLQERVKLMENQIRAAHAYCEKLVKKLHSERDEKVAELKSNIAMIGKLMEIEKQNMGNIEPPRPSLKTVA
jgi:hypothetical protein